MRTISLLSVGLVLILAAGCTTFRQPMIDEAMGTARALGYRQSPYNKYTMLSPRAVQRIAASDPLMAIQLGVDPDAPPEFADSLSVQEFSTRYNISPMRQSINVGEMCWKDHPVKWPIAVAADKGGPYLLVTGTAAGIGWGISELVDGGGSGKDDGKTETTINGDGNTVTYYENDGDVNNDSHDYSGPAE